MSQKDRRDRDVVQESVIGRPNQDQLDAMVNRSYDNAVKRAKQSLQREGADATDLDRSTRVWLETQIQNFRRWAKPGIELTPATGYLAEMYPGCTKEDLAMLADMLEGKLNGMK